MMSLITGGAKTFPLLENLSRYNITQNSLVYVTLLVTLLTLLLIDVHVCVQSGEPRELTRSCGIGHGFG